MAVDPNLPVIIGAGQITHHAETVDDGKDPASLIDSAIRAAAADAGLDAVPDPDALRIVNLLSWKYGNPARVVADRMRLAPKELGYTTVGGNSPQALVNETARQIQEGMLDVAILAGAEAWRTRMRARRSDVTLGWTKAPADDAPVMFGTELTMNTPAEIERGIVMPIQVYPMFETAIRAAAGRSVEDHLVHVSELWARFSDVAASNPFAWSGTPMTAEEIRTPTATNRLVGLPYTKVMNSNNDVDMGAALIVCSVAAAERLGVPRDRWVFVHSGADCHEHQFLSDRDTFSRTPAIEIGGLAALDLAATTIDDVALVDLYSCFPSAVQLGASSLGISPDRQLTRTGGLAFAGGPWNNYVMHAIATMVADLRAEPGELGLVWGNGGYVTKHSFGVYSARPPADGFRSAHPQDDIDRQPQRQLALPADAEGPATIEAYTVMHDRDGRPELAIAACLLADGRRAWGTSLDGDGAATALTDGEWVGRLVHLDERGTLRLP